jgi:hypothetical protein
MLGTSSWHIENLWKHIEKTQKIEPDVHIRSMMERQHGPIFLKVYHPRWNKDSFEHINTLHFESYSY